MTALATFARSLRPRAQLLVRLQMGATVEADRCEAEAWDDFQALAPQHPIGQWPLRYWNRLLRSPALAEADIDHLPTALQPLPATERAAWLLRHIAHLDEAHAAGCLDIPAIRYAEALRRAESLLVAAGYHAPKMQRLKAQWLAALDPQAPKPEPEKPQAIADSSQITRQRPATTAMEHASPADSTQNSAVSTRWLWMIGLLLILGLIIAAVWLWSARTPAPAPEPAVVPVAASEASLTVLHPDYDLLRRVDEQALAERLDRLSWWSAQNAQPAPSGGDEALRLPASAPERFDALPAKERELLASIALSWDALDAAQRARLHANASHWLGLSEPARNALLRARQDWDNSSRADREARRQRLQLWLALRPGEQARLRQAARDWNALAVEEREMLESRFLALDAGEREAWWLGPSLGRQFPALAALFEFAPPADRERLLAVLRAMDDAQRGAVAQRLQDSTPTQRERLRAELLR